MLINENFDYEAGPLHKGMDIPAPNDGGWYMFSGFGDNPVNVIDGSLTYADYAPDAVGRSVAMPKNGDDVLRAFNGVTSGTVYYSALVKVNAARKPAPALRRAGRCRGAVSTGHAHHAPRTAERCAIR